MPKFPLRYLASLVLHRITLCAEVGPRSFVSYLYVSSLGLLRHYGFVLPHLPYAPKCNLGAQTGRRILLRDVSTRIELPFLVAQASPRRDDSRATYRHKFLDLD